MGRKAAQPAQKRAYPANHGDLHSAMMAHDETAGSQPERLTSTAASSSLVRLQPPFYPPFQWKPRESVVIPVLITLAALVLLRQYPAGHPVAAGIANSAVTQTPVNQVANKPVDLTRIAVLKADGLETAVEPFAPVAAIGHPPMEAIDIPAAEVAVRDVGHIGAVPTVRACEVQDVPQSTVPSSPIPASQFGSALAAAAEAQTRDFVVYDDEYRVIRYPGGDVASLYGVCTDVIIRAYRSLGIDLQRLVHESQVGSADTNISHRRTIALRRFFEKAGASVPVTDFAEDYLPGDVVTYHRPQNSGSNDHIAIVSNATGPSGRPMIVHNRGFGPQVEDALFVDEITGHFRFSGPAASAASGTPVIKASSHHLKRSPGGISNSVARMARRAAALRAATANGGQKPAPKL
jgi:uncharacterized protein YijF (DUF1287 family)